MELESIQIHLNSSLADKYNGSTLSDCDFYLPVIEIPSQHYIYLSVQHAVIPYSFYNVSSLNNVLNYDIINIVNSIPVPSSYSLVIPSGNYNSIQLATFLTSNLPSITVTYNTITNKYLFVHPTLNFRLNYLNNSTCGGLLGLSLTPSQNVSTSLSYTSVLCVNMQPSQCICISSNFDSGNINIGAKNNRTIIASIPIIGQPYSLIGYQNPNNFKVNLFSNVLSKINIKLQDQLGNTLDLNGQYFTLTLQLDVVKFVA